MLNCCYTGTRWHTARRILPGLFTALHPSSRQMRSDLLSALCFSRPPWQIRFIQAKCPSASELDRSGHASFCISDFRKERRKWCKHDTKRCHRRPTYPRYFIAVLKWGKASREYRIQPFDNFLLLKYLQSILCTQRSTVNIINKRPNRPSRNV